MYGRLASLVSREGAVPPLRDVVVVSSRPHFLDVGLWVDCWFLVENSVPMMSISISL